MTTLFICYGNDLIGNNAFGHAVYEALPDSVNKIFTIQLLPELLEKAKDYERLIFVDAAHGSGGVDLYEIEITIIKDDYISLTDMVKNIENGLALS